MAGDGLQIVASGTSEGLTAIVSNAGVARIPYPVFRGIVRTFKHIPRAEPHVCFLRWTANSERHGLPPSSNLGRLTGLAKFKLKASSFVVAGGSIISSVKRGLAKIG